MTNHLSIASDLTLPIEAVTETFAILAKRGAGKTYTANVLAEEMLTAGAQVVILDPLDAWWGLRSSADGDGPGLPIYVFGGEHGDLPLEATAGELIADVVVDHRVSVVCSLRHLSKGKQRQFVTAFLERLYHRKGEPEHRTPLHLFIDEADAFVPQRVMSDVARTVGAVDDIVRRGRSAGLGVTLISQRAAVVNKDVLTQCEVLIALRTISPQDRKALDAWVEAHDAHDQHETFMASLASLEVGEAWVWSPGWLDIFQRVHIRKRRTFDSSSTPKAGEVAVTPSKRADVDLEALATRMAETVEKAEANDPRKLKARIAALERELAAKPKAEKVVERVEVPVVDADRLEAALAALDDLQARMAEVSKDVASAAFGIVSALHGSQAPAPRQAMKREPAPAPRPRAAPALAPQVNGEAKLGRAERALLAVLAQFPEGRSKAQLSVLSGYSIKSSSFANALGSLRSNGLADGRDPITITADGMTAAGDIEPLPTGADLQDHWRQRLGRAERTILDVLIDAYPQALVKEEISERSGYSLTSSSFANALGKLRTLQLADGYAEVRAADVLF